MTTTPTDQMMYFGRISRDQRYQYKPPGGATMHFQGRYAMIRNKDFEMCVKCS